MGGGAGWWRPDSKRVLVWNDKWPRSLPSEGERPSEDGSWPFHLNRGALFFADRTFIVRPPEDSTVIKGTTAALQCEAAHDPRISIRSVVTAVRHAVYLNLTLPPRGLV